LLACIMATVGGVLVHESDCVLREEVLLGAGQPI
jgi:hypothetical protein